MEYFLLLGEAQDFMNEQDYQLLIDLYETKNITKVADQHFLTQPALTKRLRRIEEELGSVLLVRSRKGVVFNSVGESVISYCRQMCEMNEQLRNSINASKGIVGGSLSIGTSINYCRYRLPSVMRTYTEKYPMVDISISTGHSQTLFRQLSEGKFPIAILRGEYPWAEGRILLSSEPVCFVCSRENADQNPAEYPYISHHTDPDEERRLNQWAQEHGLNIQNSRMILDDINSCREMAAAGLGWTTLPSICLRDFPGKVVPLFLKDGTPLRRNTYLLYHAESYELLQVQKFLETIEQYERNTGILAFSDAPASF